MPKPALISFADSVATSSRRIWLQTASAAATGILNWKASLPAWGDEVAPEYQGEPAPLPLDATEQMRSIAEAFLKTHNAPGLSAAFALDSAIVHRVAFGSATLDRTTPLEPRHRFRIASVSKPITAAAIMLLVDQGKLSLDSRVLGPGGILEMDYSIYNGDPRLGDITVDHLLCHTSGGWGKEKDPMFQNDELNTGELIQWTLVNRPLEHEPGANHDYSNFGYCLLGRVIENVSHQPYDTYVKNSVLKRCGISEMCIAGSTKEERLEDEVEYLAQTPEDADSPYSVNMRRIDAVGGWLATSEDLVHFAVGVGNKANETTLLSPASLEKMVEPSEANKRCARGWFVNPQGHRWHNGSLPGVSSILVSTSFGITWAALMNTRFNEATIQLDELMWEMARAVPDWRKRMKIAG